MREKQRDSKFKMIRYRKKHEGPSSSMDKV